MDDQATTHSVDIIEENIQHALDLPSFWSFRGQRVRWADPLFRRMIWNILILAWAWSLGEGAFFIQISTTTLAATTFANWHLATIPIGSMLLVGTIYSIFLPQCIARFGFRLPLYFGALMGMTGAAICILATWFQIYGLLVLGAAILGGQVPCTLYYRLLALQFSTEEFAPKAIAMVVAGGCLSSLIGPEIAKYTVHALEKPYSGAYLTTLCECALLLFALTIVQFSHAKKPDYTPVPTAVLEDSDSNRRKPARFTFVIAAMVGFVAWSAMAIQMSAAPLAMTAVGHNFNQITTTVEYHLLGMFAPSFFTGTLCNWFGNRFVMLIGLLIELTGTLLFQRGFKFGHFNLGLTLVGIGWNFSYVGASALLTQTHGSHSLFEAIIMSSITISFFSSSFIVQYFGWMILTGKIISIYLGATILILVFYFNKIK